MSDDGATARTAQSSHAPPPLQPGEWRSLGLFAADDRQLDEVLAQRPAGPSRTLRRPRRRAKELAEQRHLELLWVLPGQGRALGLWQARDAAEMEAIVKLGAGLGLDPLGRCRMDVGGRRVATADRLKIPLSRCAEIA